MRVEDVVANVVDVVTAAGRGAVSQGGIAFEIRGASPLNRKLPVETRQPTRHYRDCESMRLKRRWDDFRNYFKIRRCIPRTVTITYWEQCHAIRQ